MTYTDRQREIFGVYTTPKLKLTVEKGYKILQIWGLGFQTFLKWKTEAFGFPAFIFDINNP